MEMKLFVESILYAYAQIFFSNRKWFGAAVIAASFITPEIGLMSLAGVVLSNAAAFWLKFDEEKVRSGFYGFNGILMGAASLYFFKPEPFLVILILVFILLTFFAAAVLENYLMAGFNLPGLSLPFIISLYIFLIFLRNYSGIEASELTEWFPGLIAGGGGAVENYFKAMGFIIFQPDPLSGIILAGALLIFSRVLFFLSAAAFTLNYFLLKLLLPELHETLILVSGFNAILTSFALGGSLILPSRKSFLLVLLSCVFVVIITGFFYRFLEAIYLPILVLPFNLIVLSTLYSLKFRKDQTELVLLYFKPGSPEENHYYHIKRSERFNRFKYIYPELPFFGEWYVSQGFNGDITHKEDWKYAWDFIITDSDNKQFSGDGTALTDYYCFKIPVTAPLEGTVAAVVDGIPNNKPGEVNIEQNWGNTIILKHEYDLYSSLSHLNPGSAKVKTGEKVKKGQIIAECGSSGRSPYPHLHFQFQTSSTVGDKTHKFPFAHFISRNGSEAEINTFTYPEEDTTVQNIETHSALKKAFDFKYDHSNNIVFDRGSGQVNEEWKTDVDIANQMFLTDGSGNKASFYKTDKLFYFTGYTGEKGSALYYFYLCAMQIPFSYNPGLRWYETYSPAELAGGIVRYLSDLIITFGSPLKAKADFKFSTVPHDDKAIHISNVIKMSGSGMLSFYKKNFHGEIFISKEGRIEKFRYSDEKKELFTAEFINPGAI